MSYKSLIWSLLGLIAASGLMWANSHALAAEKTVGRRWNPKQQVSIDKIEHDPFDQLLQKYVDENGRVNYEKWKDNADDRKSLQSYLELLGRANPKRIATRQAKLAYWINAYNAVTIEGILQVYPTSSIRNHTASLIGYNIWDDLKLHTGDTKYSLNEIEHKILRPMGEPRIHFAIVCASIGCPRLLDRAYTAEKLEQQLSENSKDFFSRKQNFQLDSKNKTVRVSSILKWFRDDFGDTPQASVQSMTEYLPQDAAKFVTKGNFKVRYLSYDWDLNKQ